MLVSDLMDTETKQWDREKISSLFAYRTRMEILSIPLQNSTAQDKMEWEENRNRIFTVKSAYKVALRLQENTQAEHSSWVGSANMEENLETKHPSKGTEFSLACMLQYSAN